MRESIMNHHREKILVSGKNLSLSLDRQHLLEGVSIEISKEEIVTVVGPNGAGKTTLLKILLGLLKPDRGTVEKKSGLRVGYLPQKLNVDPVLPLSVERMMTLTENFPRNQVNTALEKTGVAALIDEPVQNLSGGEFQRMMLARALLRNAELLVLDEPAQGVDHLGESELYGLIGRLKEVRGCGVLMVSHDLHLVMAATDEVICLQRHVCCSGSPESVSRDPAYHELFGPGAGTPNLALYTHDHDHDHDLHGDAQPGHHHDGNCHHD